MNDYQVDQKLLTALKAHFPTFGVERDLGRGTAFPSTDITLAADDRFFRTDLGFLCYYDGTRWLTAHEYVFALPFADYSASDSFANWVRFRTDYNLYATRVTMTTRVSTTNNGTNFWTIAIEGQNQAFSGGTTIYQPTTAADTAGTFTSHETTANVVLTSLAHFNLSVQKTLTPGTLRISWAVYYRLIIT